MVAQVDRRGFRDWLAQRVTAILIGVYAIVIIAYLLAHHPVHFIQWKGLFADIWMKFFTFIVLLSVLWHGWVGIWTVFTDYVKNKPLRLFLEILVILLFALYLAWIIDILW